MLTASKWVLGIVTGGLLLGTLLGKAADPDMKEAPAPWWQLTGRGDVAASDDYQLVDLRPPSLPGGYRPDLDYNAEAWSLPIPEYDLVILLEEPLKDDWPAPAYATEPLDDPAAGAGPADDTVDAPADEESADSAPADGVRKSHLAMAGLY
jgi:hypothetical protein